MFTSVSSATVGRPSIFGNCGTVGIFFDHGFGRVEAFEVGGLREGLSVVKLCSWNFSIRSRYGDAILGAPHRRFRLGCGVR